MANVGTAHLLIVPKFDNLEASVRSALSGVSGDAVGAAMGNSIAVSAQSGVSSGMSSAAVTVGNLVSKVISSGVDMIASHVDSAVSRVDTLKNYPLVMESLGVSAEESTASIELMTAKLDGLPTTLDTMSTTVQGLYAAGEQYGITLTTATQAGLALNDMLLAGGGSQQVVNSALEQFRQILSKGKPDMQDWRSLMSAAPGQMNQLAQSMLGATATTNDLYYALGGGNASDEHTEGIEYASISVNELLDALIALDNEGGEAVASFADQAETAQGGIETAAANFSNAWTKGIAGTIDAVGRENIVGVIDAAKGAVNDLFGLVNDGLGNFGLWLETFDDGRGAIDRMSESMQALNGDIETFNGTEIDMTALEHALERSQEDAEKASEAHADYIRQLNDSADVIDSVVESCNDENSALEYAYEVIERYGDKAGLTAIQQWELQSALDTVNEKCGTQLELIDPLNGKIGDAEGAYDNAAEAVWRYVDAQVAANRAIAYGDIVAEKEDIVAAARNDYSASRQSVDTSWSALQPYIEKYGGLEGVKNWLANPDGGWSLVSTGWNQWSYEGNFSEEQQSVKGLIENLESAVGNMRESSEGLRAQTESLNETQAQALAYNYLAEGNEQNVLSTVLTSSVAGKMFGEGGTKEALSLVDFANALDQCVVGSENLMKYLSDDETMMKFAEAFDGNAWSLKSFVDELEGVDWNAEAARLLDAGSSVNEIRDWLNDLDDGAYIALQSMYGNVDELSQAFEDAGVSALDLTHGVKANFEDMCQKAGGDIDKLAFLIKHYNEDCPVVDKDGTVTIDDEQLYDAEGRIVVWNSETMRLEYKDTGVEVEAQQLYDAELHCYNWNKIELKSLSTAVYVDQSSINSAIGKLQQLKQMASTGYSSGGSAYIGYTSTGYSTKALNSTLGFASGGFRVHADGGIATKATFLSDIVGEDGDEAIVPLTNRKYAQPFIDMLADGLTKQSGGPVTVNNNNVYLNGELLDVYANLKELVFAVIEDLVRVGAANVGNR